MASQTEEKIEILIAQEPAWLRRLRQEAKKPIEVEKAKPVDDFSVHPGIPAIRRRRMEAGGGRYNFDVAETGGSNPAESIIAERPAAVVVDEPKTAPPPAPVEPEVVPSEPVGDWHALVTFKPDGEGISWSNAMSFRGTGSEFMAHQFEVPKAAEVVPDEPAQPRITAENIQSSSNNIDHPKIIFDSPMSDELVEEERQVESAKPKDQITEITPTISLDKPVTEDQVGELNPIIPPQLAKEPVPNSITIDNIVDNPAGDGLPPIVEKAVPDKQMHPLEAGDSDGKNLIEHLSSDSLQIDYSQVATGPTGSYPEATGTTINPAEIQSDSSDNRGFWAKLMHPNATVIKSISRLPDDQLSTANLAEVGHDSS